MRKLFVFCVIMCAVHNSVGQKMPDDYFTEANLAFECKNYRKAIPLYRYLYDSYPEYKNNHGVLRLLTASYKEVGMLDSCLSIAYKAYWDMPEYARLDPKDDYFGGDYRYFRKEDSLKYYRKVVAQFDIYRHTIARTMSTVFCKKKLYDSALKYLYISDTLYPGWINPCGTMRNFDDEAHVRMKRYADIYEQKGDKNTLLKCMLTTILAFPDSANLLKIKPLLRQLGDARALLLEFQQASSKIESDIPTLVPVSDTLTDPGFSETQFLPCMSIVYPWPVGCGCDYIMFAGIKMFVDFHHRAISNEELGARTESIMGSAFYKMLVSLNN